MKAYILYINKREPHLYNHDQCNISLKMSDYQLNHVMLILFISMKYNYEKISKEQQFI